MTKAFQKSPDDIMFLFLAPDIPEANRSQYTITPAEGAEGSEVRIATHLVTEDLRQRQGCEDYELVWSGPRKSVVNNRFERFEYPGFTLPG